MAFDADKYLEALQPPVFTLGGVKYTGRFLSTDEWAPFVPRIEKLQAGQMSYMDTQQLIRDFCFEAFPARWWDVMRGKTVAQQIVKLPARVVLKAAADFFGSQARAMDVERALVDDDVEINDSD